MTANWDVLVDQSVSGVATATFSNIPQGYRSIVIHADLMVATGNQALVNMRFNGTSSNYGSIGQRMSSGTLTNLNGSGYGQDRAGLISQLTYYDLMNCVIEIPNYSGTYFYKQWTQKMLQQSNPLYENRIGGWQDKSAITSITIFNSNTTYNWSASSRIRIYGLV
jgi:hypothetical protein